MINNEIEFRNKGFISDENTYFIEKEFWAGLTDKYCNWQ